MNRRLYHMVIMGGLATLLLPALACGTDIKPVEDRVGAVEKSVTEVQAKLASVEAKAGKIAAPAGSVEFSVTGAELKGSTVLKDLATPTINPKDLSDGYRYKKPGDADKNDPTKWEVSTYVWSPAAMTVLQGDKVDLRIFIVNGDKHTVWVEGPDGKEVVKEQEQNRGREYIVSFTASQSGTYKLTCNEHDPTMRSVITSLPRS